MSETRIDNPKMASPAPVDSHLGSLHLIRDQLAQLVSEADRLAEHALSACICHALDRAEDSIRRHSRQPVCF